MTLPMQPISPSGLDQRSREIFRQIVESYLREGEPVGSRNLARILPQSLSPATIRNVMSDLEELGLIASPHTSAGRIPTARGYRLFVDTMLTARPLDLDQAPPDLAAARGQLHPDQPQRVIAQAAQLFVAFPVVAVVSTKGPITAMNVKLY